MLILMVSAAVNRLDDHGFRRVSVRRSAPRPGSGFHGPPRSRNPPGAPSRPVRCWTSSQTHRAGVELPSQASLRNDAELEHAAGDLEDRADLRGFPPSWLTFSRCNHSASSWSRSATEPSGRGPARPASHWMIVGSLLTVLSMVVPRRSSRRKGHGKLRQHRQSRCALLRHGCRRARCSGTAPPVMVLPRITRSSNIRVGWTAVREGALITRSARSRRTRMSKSALLLVT